MRKTIVLAFGLFAQIGAYAQEDFRNPVKNEKAINRQLFELGREEHNHIFQVILPGDNFLLIDFARMSTWPDTSVLPLVFNTAAATAASVKDSFKSLNNSKRIDIHMPVKNSPLQVRLTEHSGSELLHIQYGSQAPLKVGMDTIRILKTMEAEYDKDNGEERSEIQYTFVLKSLSEIEKLADNKELIADIAQTIDSVVQAKRSRWNKQDRWYHHIGIKYNPLEPEKAKQLKVQHPAGFFKGLDANYYWGATLFRNTLAPYLEVGGSYKWPGDIGEYDYVRVSLSAIGLFERQSESVYNYYSASFVNAEIGTWINKTDTWIPVYETSIGFGYMFTDHPSMRQHHVGKMFFNYSISPAIRITPDLYVLFRKGQDNYVWGGLTVSVKIL